MGRAGDIFLGPARTPPECLVDLERVTAKLLEYQRRLDGAATVGVWPRDDLGNPIAILVEDGLGLPVTPGPPVAEAGQPRRILFLDMDGVLNSAAFYAARGQKDGRENDRKTNPLPSGLADYVGGPAQYHVWRAWSDIDPAAVARLNRILVETGAEVVLSSTWRLLYELPVLQRVLEEHGFVGRLVGATPSLADYQTDAGLWIARERGDEIRAWLDANAPDAAFVVLDDVHDMTAVAMEFVATLWATGLLDEHVDEAIDLLTYPPVCGGDTADIAEWAAAR